MGRLAPALIALAVAAGLAACGGGAHTTQSLPGNVPTLTHLKTTTPPVPLEIDAALPLTGPDASQGIALEHGMQLALADGGERAGHFSVDPDFFNDADRSRGWNAGALATKVREWATNSSTILYIGDLPSGASQVTIPILGAAAIPQIITGSPDTTLTSVPAGASGTRTTLPSNYIRLAPTNAYQAQAMLRTLRTARHGFPACTKVAVVYGDDPDSRDLAAAIGTDAAAYRPMTVLTAADPIDPGKPAAFAGALAALKAHGANCAVLADTIPGGGVTVTEGLHEQLAPGARIVASSGLCTGAWTNPAQGGVPASVDPDLSCTAPGPGLSQTAAGRHFASEFRKSYKVDPDPAAAYGYEAMTLALEAIKELGPDGNDRSSVLAELRTIFDPDSVIGTVGFIEDGTAAGNTTNQDYSLYEVGSDGTLKFARQLQTTAPAAAGSPTG